MNTARLLLCLVAALLIGASSTSFAQAEDEITPVQQEILKRLQELQNALERLTERVDALEKKLNKPMPGSEAMPSMPFFAIGQNKRKKKCSPGYTLSYTPQPKSILGKVVDIEELDEGVTLYTVESSSGEKVIVTTDKDNLKKWLIQSWEGKCSVKVDYVPTRIDGKARNKILKVKPRKK